MDWIPCDCRREPLFVLLVIAGLQKHHSLHRKSVQADSLHLVETYDETRSVQIIKRLQNSKYLIQDTYD